LRGLDIKVDAESFPTGTVNMNQKIYVRRHGLNISDLNVTRLT